MTRVTHANHEYPHEVQIMRLPVYATSDPNPLLAHWCWQNLSPHSWLHDRDTFWFELEADKCAFLLAWS